MSKSEIERFVRDIRTDPKLQAAFEGRSLDGPGLVAVARESGYDVTAEDVEAHVRAQSRELSEEELDSAAGGAILLLSIEVGLSKTAKLDNSTSGGGTTTGGGGNPVLVSGVVGIGLL